ncbi:MAG TPA: GNAT family N-acetyltransferase [Acidimicrobiia bacterium]|nr:GNAT family N-acetyltransferase [Acidimicrobiia bacterium]
MEDARAARVDDVERLTVLARLLVDELAPMRGGEVWAARDARPEPLADGVRALLQRDDVRVVVGTIDDVPVGFGIVVVETLRDGRRLGRITELFVEPEARAVGVGERMLAELVRHCDERGCIGIDAAALPGHRATKNFFEGAGFTARLLVMHHPLDRTERP